MSLMDQLMEVASSQITKQAAEKTGLAEGMAAKMMPMALSAIMGGLKKNAASPQGAEALASALNKHDGGLLDNISQLGNADILNDGQKMLGHILGGNQQVAEETIAKAAGGVSTSQAKDLMAMIAPVVLASLGKAKKEQGLDISALAGLVQNEGAQAQQKAGSELSGLMAMLDADGDGDIKDEALGIGKKLLGGLFKR